MKRFLPWMLLLLVSTGCVIKIVSPDVVPNPTPVDTDTTVVVPSPQQISVLILEETDDRRKLEMRPWLGVFQSSAIRNYLNEHCKNDGWRWLDADADLSNLPEFWRDTVSKVKADPDFKTPWIAISNGKQGVAGELPSSEDEVLTLLRKWGGD